MELELLTPTLIRLLLSTHDHFDDGVATALEDARRMMRLGLI